MSHRRPARRGPGVRVPADRRRGSRGRGRPGAREVQRRRAGCRKPRRGGQGRTGDRAADRSAAEVFVRAAHLLEAFGVDFTRDRSSTPSGSTLQGRAACGMRRRTKRHRFRMVPTWSSSTRPQPAGPATRTVPRRASGHLRHDRPRLEGAGRGFSVRFRDRLADCDLAVTDVSLRRRFDTATPTLWRCGRSARCCWTRARRSTSSSKTRRLRPSSTGAFGGGPARRHAPAPRGVRPARPRALPDRTGGPRPPPRRPEPDAPGAHPRGPGRLGGAAGPEGGLSASTRATMYEGGRVRGNMLPDVLSTHSGTKPPGFRSASESSASQPTLRSGPVDSAPNSSRSSDEFADDADYLGVGFGATPELVRFWATTATAPSTSQPHGTRPAASTPS